MSAKMSWQSSANFIEGDIALFDLTSFAILSPVSCNLLSQSMAPLMVMLALEWSRVTFGKWCASSIM
jgi:hypothetical protein